MKNRLLSFFKQKRTTELPAFWEAYLTSMGTPPVKSSLLEAVEFVVLDTETTGLNPTQDRILSIGAIRVRHNEIHIGETRAHLVRQTIPGGVTQIPIHGILPARTSAAGLTESQAMEEFIRFVGNAVLVAHHAAFDRKLLNQALERMHLSPLKNKWVDTAVLARRVAGVQPHPQKLDLDTLCALYRIPLHDRHTALGDAYITAVLFLKLVDKLKIRGVHTLGDLLRRPFW